MSGIVGDIDSKSRVLGNHDQFASEWNLTSGLTGVTSDTNITANLAERPTDTSRGYEKIGASMTVSSGVFSFPATGLWEVSFTATGAGPQPSRENHIRIRSAIDGSTFDVANLTSYNIPPNAGGNNHGFNCTAVILFGVDDITTHKVIFGVQCTHSSVAFRGSTDNNATTFRFIRYGGL